MAQPLMKKTILLALFVVVMSKIDQFEESEYWNSIKDGKHIEKVKINEFNEINQPPSANRADYLKVVCISDTHDQMDKALATLPDGDVLIHAGDFTCAGGEENLKEFNRAINSAPHKHKIIVAGNHELGFDDFEDLSKRDPKWVNQGTARGYNMLENVTILHDQGIEIDGVSFYGASWHPLPGYPFSVERPKLKEKWEKMPNNVDVLVTHTPPLGYLDNFGDEKWGCRYLLNEVEQRVKPKFHVFGHVHECYGVESNGVTTFVNAAQCNKKNLLSNKPFVFYIMKKKQY